MITKEHIIPIILEACPSFGATYEASDDKELDYIIAGELADHLLKLFQEKKVDEFPELAKVIERFHIDGDSYVKEYATIGILESVQNVWGNNKVDPNEFCSILLPMSLKYWKSLNDFWAEKIPCVGHDVDTPET